MNEKAFYMYFPFMASQVSRRKMLKTHFGKISCN